MKRQRRRTRPRWAPEVFAKVMEWYPHPPCASDREARTYQGMARVMWDEQRPDEKTQLRIIMHLRITRMRANPDLDQDVRRRLSAWAGTTTYPTGQPMPAFMYLMGCHWLEPAPEAGSDQERTVRVLAAIEAANTDAIVHEKDVHAKRKAMKRCLSSASGTHRVHQTNDQAIP